MSDIPVEMKFGRKPPKNAPSLMLADFLTGVIPEHPLSENYLGKLQNWQVLGNDRYGDCVAVTWANMRRLVTGLLTPVECYPTFDQVLALYKTQNPNFPTQDDGMDIQTCLEYLNHTGGPDGVKMVAFARVNLSNLEEIKAALAIFGSVWLGVYVQRANMSQFSQGLPWEYVQGSPNAGGHSILGGGYLSVASNDVRFITWGRETGCTDLFWGRQVEEAWVAIWPEQLGTVQFMEGIDLNKLATAYKQLTGRDLPITPTPTPPPSPSSQGCLPGALSALAGLFRK